MGIEVIVEHEPWRDVGLKRLAEQTYDATAAVLGWQERTFDCALLGCDDARIADLNADFRGKPRPTNVLSWPSLERSEAIPCPDDSDLGDIALAYETCAREAAEQAKPLDHHVRHLISHGLLHLLGYDHERDEEAAEMERTEIEILAKLGIPNPY